MGSNNYGSSKNLVPEAKERFEQIKKRSRIRSWNTKL